MPKPEPVAPAMGVAGKGDLDAADTAAEAQPVPWKLHHGVRMTKRLKTHILMNPDGDPAMYARTLDEVLTFLYERGIQTFDMIEGRRQWTLHLAGPPSEVLERTELDNG